MPQCQTLSVPDAGAILGCGRNLSFRLAKEGRLPVVRLGRKLRVPKSAVQRILDEASIVRRRETSS